MCEEGKTLGTINWEPRDLLRFTFLSDPRFSPDGTSIVFVEHQICPKVNQYQSNIRWMDPAGERVRPFTTGYDRDTHPRFSPDGRWLGFLSTRPIEGVDAGQQLWVMPTGGGEARPVTEVEGGIEQFTWSPDGQSLAITMHYPPTEGPRPVTRSDFDDDLDGLQRKYNADVKHITNIIYKVDGEGYREGKRRQVGVVGCPDEVTLFPEIQPVTFGDYDHAEPAWSPDGRWLAVCACREEDSDLKTFKDLWLFPVGHDAAPIKVTDSIGDVALPAWSPDGRRIAYLGFERKRTGWYDHRTLWIAELDEAGNPGSVIDLTGHWDVEFGVSPALDVNFSGLGPELTWSSDGKTVYYITGERGATHLLRVDARDGTCELLTTGDRVIYDADLRPDLGRAVMAVATPDNPGIISALEFDDPKGVLKAGGFSDEVLKGAHQALDEQVLYRSNEDLLREKSVAVAERFTFRAADDAPWIDGWLLKADEHISGDGSVPNVLQIHGGPNTMYTQAFFFEFQLLVSAGYAVVFTNPRGSSGYGEAFRTAIEPGWGTVDYEDVMAGISTALSRFPYLDEKRTGVAGGSYGGYLTNWIIGHTNRFRAAITMRCVADLTSFWGTSDFGPLWWTDMFGGYPWEAHETFRQQSPITHLGGAKTPTLVIHSEEDHRCPVEQGEQVFRTLKAQGVPAELVRYPEESHGLSRSGKPWHRIDRLQRILDWFDRFL